METRIIEIDPRELKLLKLNARYMRHEEYQKLVANIKRDGQLTSAPFACWDGDGYLVLSGNHRTQAAIAADLEKIPCIVTDEDLSADQRAAIQLSHNAIAGQDDPYLLKEIYESILDLNWKEYCGLDDKTLELLDKASAQALSEVNLKFSTLSVIFLPDELKEAEFVIQQAREAAKNADSTWLAKRSQYDDWLEAQENAMASYKVKNVATAIDLILKIFTQNVTQLQAGYDTPESDKNWVPLETIFGRRKVPASTAKKVSKVLSKIQGEKKFKSNEMWRGLEILAEQYLSGGE